MFEILIAFSSSLRCEQINSIYLRKKIVEIVDYFNTTTLTFTFRIHQNRYSYESLQNKSMNVYTSTKLAVKWKMKEQTNLKHYLTDDNFNVTFKRCIINIKVTWNLRI